MKARIFQKPKNAMQSGRAGTQRWMLEYAPAEARKADPLMGWAGSGDTRGQLRLGFASRDEALAYAVRNGIEAEVVKTRAHVEDSGLRRQFSVGRARSIGNANPQ